MLRVLKVLNQVLEPRTFLVGESITLADMAVASAVLLPFKYVSIFFKTFFFPTGFPCSVWSSLSLISVC